MLGCYKKTREDIVSIIKKSPKTQDGYYICKKFIDLNKKIGEHKDAGYIYNRDKYANKICFNEAEIEKIVKEIFAKVNPTGPNDIGKVMKACRRLLKA